MTEAPAASRSDSLVWLFAYVTFFVVLSFVKAPAVLIDAGPSWKRELAKCPPSEPCEIAIWPNGWSVKLQSAR